MSEQKRTLGQAIDQAIDALEPLDPESRKTALSAVCAHLQIELAENVGGGGSKHLDGPSNSPPPPAVHDKAPPPAAPSEKTDIRSLKEQKQPRSARQMACIVAYYLQENAPENERKENISAGDLERYFKQAGFKLPNKISQVLPDAKSAGYFDSAGRGEYKLNAVGYNLVAHTLPTSSET